VVVGVVEAVAVGDEAEGCAGAGEAGEGRGVGSGE